MAALAAAAADLLAASNRFKGLLPEQPLHGSSGAADVAGPAFAGEGFGVYVQSLGGHLLITVNQTAAVPAAAVSTVAPVLLERAKLDAAKPDADLYGGAQVLCLIVAFALGWSLLHFLVPLPQRGKLAGPRLTYWRRTIRAQLYYVGAAVSGVLLAWEYSTPYELVYRFTRMHQVVLACSIAHWVVATVEDSFSQTMLSQGLERIPQLGNAAKDLIYKGYFIHHLASIGILAFCLWMQCLSALAVCGLVFEAPVVLMNVREFLYNFGDFLGLPRRSESTVNVHWYTTFALFLLSRGGPSALWIYATLYWGFILQTLPSTIWYVGHSAAFFFTVMNFYIFNLLTIWYREDLTDASAAGKKGGLKADAHDEERPVAHKDLDSTSVRERAGHHASEAPPGMQGMGMTDCVSMKGGTGHADMFEAPPAPQEMGMTEPARANGGGAGAEHDGSTAKREKVKSAVKVQNKDLENKLKLARPYRYASFYDTDHSVEVQSSVITLMLISAGGYWLLTCSWGIRGINAGREQRFAVCLITLACSAPLALLRAAQVKRVPQVLSRCLSPLVHVAALCLAGLLAAFFECLWDATPQLMNGAALALLLQQLLQQQAPAAIEYWLLLPVSMWISPWHWPCAAFAACILVLPHALGRASRDAWVVTCMSVILLSGLYAALAVLYSWRFVGNIAPIHIGVLGTKLPPTCHYVVAAWALVHLHVFWFENFGRCARQLSPSMAVRTACFIMLLLHAGDKLVWAAALLQLRRLQLETREVVARPGCDFRLLVVQEGFDTFRGLTLGGVWRVCAGGLMGVINFLLPSELQVYAFPSPFPITGPEVSLGLSILVSGPRDVAPTSFVCNVGHIDRNYDGWYGDLTRTARSALGIVREFDKADKQQLGLVSNLLCLVPVRGNEGRGTTSYVKEFNFSAWETPKHAFQWYAGSPEHKEILAEHNNGSLRNFGNVLANMQLSKPMRWQARCSRCAGLVNKYPEIRECPCGAPVIDMPLF